VKDPRVEANEYSLTVAPMLNAVSTKSGRRSQKLILRIIAPYS